MRKIITCGQINYNAIFPFTVPIFGCLRFFFGSYLFNLGFAHPFVLSLLVFIGEMINGSLSLIPKIQEALKKRQVDNHITKNDRVIFLFPINKITQKIQSKAWIYLFILLLVAIDCIGMNGLLFSSLQFTILGNLEYQMTMMQIIFAAIFSYFFLHIRLYRHQFAGLGILIVGIMLITFNYYKDFEVLSFFGFVLSFLSLTIKDAIEKWLMDFKFKSPFELLFYEGLFGTIALIIVLIVTCFIPCTDSLFCYDGKMESVDTFNVIFGDYRIVLLLIGFFVSTSGFSLFLILTNKLFSPSYRSVADVLSSFCWWLINILFIKKAIDALGTLIAGYIIFILGFMMYTEILIFYFFTLESNTKKEIQNRAHGETIQLNAYCLEDESQENTIIEE